MGPIFRRSFAATALLAPKARPAVAQDGWPARPVRIIVPYPPGGPTDLSARLYAEGLGDALGQRFVVDNRPGAGGAIGLAQLARSPADGYTLGLGTAGTQAVVPILQQPTPYDPLRDFAPVSQVALAPIVITASVGLSVRSLRDFLDHARRQPGRIRFASDGHGTTTHLAGELLKIMTGIDMQHVPYRGTVSVVTAVSAGEVEAGISGVSANLPDLLRDGRIRVLAVGGQTRSPGLPEVPTVEEAGVTGFDVTSWYGFFAPPDTPAAIRGRLSEEIRRIATTPGFQARLAPLFLEARAGTPEELQVLVAHEFSRWREVIAHARIRAE